MQQTRVAIIGTGFAGLGMAIRLKLAGHNDFVIFERAEDVGGVWRENTYPGAACDIPSHLYSFSFEPKLDWTRRYPQQPEILQYLRDCAKKYGLTEHIRFNCSVNAASFDDASSQWLLSTDQGEHLAQILIAGCGQLTKPAYPDIPGQDSFSGATFHSAAWDHSFNLQDKRIAVIGTGASAIQFIPCVAEHAARLKVFQRTPPWTLPKPDTEYSAANRGLFRYLPGYRTTYRKAIWKFGEITTAAFDDPEGRTAKALHKISKRQLEKNVSDPALRAKLTPDYPVGCKRVLFTSNYYEALSRPNVELHDGGVERIEPRGVVDANGELHEVDALIYGTGFAATDFLTPMAVTGANGKELNAAWKDGAEAYLGMTVSGFPNFFMLYGPNTNLGNNSIIFMIECQSNYIMQCLDAMQDNGLRQLNVRDAVMRAFNDELQGKLNNSVWSAGCHSWYKNAAGRNTNNWPGLTAQYRDRTANVNLDDFVTS